MQRGTDVCGYRRRVLVRRPGQQRLLHSAYAGPADYDSADRVGYGPSRPVRR